MARSAQDPKLPDDLLGRLSRASSLELRALVEDYGRFFGLPEVRQVLRNPFVDSDTIQELSTIRLLITSRPVQAAIARHFRAPERVAMRFIPNLFWRELLDITVDVRIRGPVRRVAERQMLERLPRLTVGERVALARRAPATTGRALARSADLRVLGALLGNPRTTVQSLMPLLSHEEASPRALGEVAAHPRWGVRYDVQVALCRNPQTPFSEIFRLLPRLSRDDLEGIVAISQHSGVVVRRAEALLAEDDRPDL